MGPHKKYEGIIFDLDGTLLNTLETYVHIANRLQQKHNYPVHSLEKYRQSIGNGTKNFISQSIPEKYRNEQQTESLTQEFLTMYQDEYQHSEVYAGIIDVLEVLQSTGIKLAILSNKFHELTCKCADHFFPTITFDRVIGQSNQYKKPDPKGVLDIAQAFDLPLDRLLLVGDTEVDILTAKNAGINSLAITWGFREEAQLAAQSPDYVVKNQVELKHFFLEHTNA